MININKLIDDNLNQTLTNMNTEQRDELQKISVTIDNIRDELASLATKISDSDSVTSIYEAIIRLEQADDELDFVWDRA